MNKKEIKFVLASNSPRRRQLFGLGGWDFSVMAADVDETPFEGESPREYVIRLAQAKALAIQAQACPEPRRRTESDAVIIGSDTTVVDGDQILGKPVDAADAERMLKQLRGRTHQVYTGVAILRVRDGNMILDLSITDVPMRDYTDMEVTAYIKTGDPMDKAGAYAIQHPDFQPVAAMEGCYAGVMGLPMCHVLRALRKMSMRTEADVPAACQTLLKYDCKVTSGILNSRGDTPSGFNEPAHS